MMRTTSAGSVGELTLALIVGVSRYRDSRIEALDAAAQEAIELERLLLSPHAARLPRRNVELLVDEQAMGDAIRSALQRMVQAASADHAVFLYFAGHAKDRAEGFLLIPHDADAGDAARTAVSSFDIDSILSPCAARGVLIVLDCCGGAAMAENAPRLFRGVGSRSEYRILLSSARAGQSSWEGPDGSRFSRALIDALAGKVVLSGEAGAIYFSDLYRHLHDSVTPSSLEAAAQQEPIAAASYARDPLLFVNADLTLSQVHMRVRRYSRAQMRAMLRRWAAGLAAAVALSLAGMIAYVEGHQFLALEGDTVALYRGVPGWRVLHYPAMTWQYDVQRDEIAPASPLASNGTVVSRWREDYRAALLDHVRPVGRARWYSNEGRPDDARPVLDAALRDASDNAQWTRAALLYATLAGAGDAPRLAELARTGQSDVAAAALSRLLSLATEDAPHIADEIGYAESNVHLQVLADAAGSCTAPLAQYLHGFATAPANGRFIRLTIDAALRLGCPLSEDVLATVVQPLHLQDVARYLAIADPVRAARLRDALAARWDEAADGELAWQAAASSAGYLTGAQPGACPHALTGIDAPFDAKLNLLRAYLRQCPEALAVLEEQPGGWRYAVRTGGVATWSADVPSNASTATLWAVLLTLDPHRLDASSVAVRGIAMGDHSTMARQRAIRLLRQAGASGPTDLLGFVRTGEHGVQHEAYLWHAQQQRRAAIDALIGRLGEDTASFVPRTLAQLALDAAERTRVVEAVHAKPLAPHLRGQMIAMFGTIEDVIAEATDPRYGPRQWLYDGLGYRSDLADVAARLPPPYAAGGTSAEDVQRLEQQRAALAREFAGLQDDQRSWRIDLMIGLRQLNNTGLLLWLQAECGECD